jgi:hypothetical protein
MREKVFILIALFLWVPICVHANHTDFEFERETLVAPDLAGSEIFHLVRQGAGSQAPKTLEGWRSLVELGTDDDKSVATFVPFSAAPAHTHLGEPRLIISVSPRLFLALIPRNDGFLEGEFISWNENQTEFDFGVMKDGRIEPANRQACLQCHVTGGPLFSAANWDNTTGALGDGRVPLAKAMLAKRIQIDPEKYGKFKKLLDEKWDLVTNLPDVTIGGFPILGSASDAAVFDRRVESATLLLQYHAVRKALPAAKRAELARHMTEVALSLERPGRFTDLRSQLRQFAQRNRADLNHEVFDLLAKSPIFSNFSPGLDFEFPDGHPAKKLPRGSVEKVLAVSEYLEKEKINGYPERLRPFTPGALAGTRANESIFRSGFLFGSTLAFEAYKVEIEKNELSDVEKVHQQLVESDIYADGNLPRVDRLKQAIDLIRAGKQVPKFIPQGTIAKSADKMRMPSHNCLGCHDGSLPGLKIPVDPTNENQWRAALANEKTRASAARWLRRTKEVLEDERMPPPDAPEAIGFDREKLLKVLEAVELPSVTRKNEP